MRFVTSGSDANETLDPARPELPRRTRRALALAGDLLRAGLPRADDGDARPDRAAEVATDRSGLPAPAPAHPAQHVAFGPDQSGGPPAARPRARAGGTRDRLGVLLRGDQRRGAPTPSRGLEGLAERNNHGFLVCFDEVVPGSGERVGGSPAKMAYRRTSSRPRKGLGAGYTAIGAFATAAVYEYRERLASVPPRCMGRRACSRA